MIGEVVLGPNRRRGDCKAEPVLPGLGLQHRYQSSNDFFRTTVANGAGEYIDKDGRTLGPPDAFTPDQYGIRSAGMVAGVSLRVAPWLRMAGSFDYLGNSIEGRNDGDLSSSELQEKRPFRTLAATAIGRIANQADYALTAERWSTGTNDERSG